MGRDPSQLSPGALLVNKIGGRTFDVIMLVQREMAPTGWHVLGFDLSMGQPLQVYVTDLWLRSRMRSTDPDDCLVLIQDG